MHARKIFETIALTLGIMMSTPANAESDKTFLVADPVRYAHGTLVQAKSDILFLGGQVGLDDRGDMPSSYEAQLKLIFENTRLVLEKADMQPSDIVEMTYYVVVGDGRMDQDYWGKIFEIRNDVLGEIEATGALIYVPALYRPEALIEISSVAAKRKRDI